ncbi:MAG TPA: M50 family metallopeptidase [Candidatus Sulfotelmatobacter sp.]|nr:M50 family metallopeptidase [Candidatus Sulfotelmatobacter sp.]
MPTGRQGSIHLFRFSGIDVFLHWSWFLIAVFEIQSRAGRYSSISWNVLEYLSLFLIVMLHEFGHALACRQVGGRANRIVLWPLGGVAYVDPPPRPGATLWSIAAGPLVNVALIPVLMGLVYMGRSAGWAATAPDVYRLVRTILLINGGLLAFNILPIYPLDGGQILRSLLWFVLGRGRSLMVATVLGMIGVVAFFGLAIWGRSIWYGALAVFMLMNCWGGLQHARWLLRLAKLPRREGFVCPTCRTSPPVGNYWKCQQCQLPFDTFQTGAVCPHCSTRYPTTQCLDCGRVHPLAEWSAAVVMAGTSGGIGSLQSISQ